MILASFGLIGTIEFTFFALAQPYIANVFYEPAFFQPLRHTLEMTMPGVSSMKLFANILSATQSLSLIHI